MKEFLHHFFLPRESNNHRAKLLHHKSLLLTILFLLLSTYLVTTLKRSLPEVLGAAVDISSHELLLLTNQNREEHGLLSLTLNDRLSQAAYEKAKDMFEKNYWAHTAPDGATPWVYFNKAGYTYLYAGENLARGFSSSSDVVSAWMASQSHKENILSGNYKEIGFAIVQGSLLGEETTLVVQMFGSSSAPVVARETTSPSVQESASVQASSSQEKPVKSKESKTPSKSNLPEFQKIQEKSSIQRSQPFAVSLRTQPFINSNVLSRNTSLIIIFLFILALTLDIIVVERRKIIRLVGHNIDHILFLGMLFVLVIALERGVIL